MKRLLEKMRKKEEGAVLVLVALLLTVLLGLTALAVDLGMAFYQRQRLQNACDAAALAGATALPNQSKAKQLAYDYMKENGFSDSPSDVIVTFEGTPAEKIKVGSKYDVRSGFAKVFGRSNVSVSCNAAAQKKEQKKSKKFPYLIFAEGGKLSMGADYEIYGAVHTNEALVTNPGDRDPGSFMEQMSYGTEYNIEGHPTIRIKDPDDGDELFWVYTVGGGNNALYFNNQTSDTKNDTYAINSRQVEGKQLSEVQDKVDNGEVNEHSKPLKIYAMSGSSTFIEQDKDIILDRDYPTLTTKVDAKIASLKSTAATKLESVKNETGWATTTDTSYVDADKSGSKTIVKAGSYWGDSKSANHTEPAIAFKNTGNSVFKFGCSGGSYDFKEVYFYSTTKKSTETEYGGFYYTSNTKMKMGSVYSNDRLSIYAATTGKVEVNGDIYCDGDLNLRCVNVTGNIYCTGSIKVEDCKIDGLLACKKNIDFIGNATSVKCKEANGRVAIYSEEGDISYYGADNAYLDLIGILYAKKGKVTLKARTKFYGNIIGKTVDASYKDIEGHPISDLPEFPEDGNPSASPGAAKKYDIVLVE